MLLKARIRGDLENQSGAAAKVAALAGALAAVVIAGCAGSHPGEGAPGRRLAAAGEHALSACRARDRLDGIAIIVKADNRVSALTVSQLRNIFSGKITAWNLVGGPPHGIHVLARDAKSGTYDTLAALVLEQSPLVPAALRFEDSPLLSATVAGDPDAIVPANRLVDKFVSFVQADAGQLIAHKDGFVGTVTKPAIAKGGAAVAQLAA